MMIMTKRRRRPTEQPGLRGFPFASFPPPQPPLPRRSSRDLSGRSRSIRGDASPRFRGVRFRELKAIMFAATTTGSFYTRAEKRAATFQSDLFFLISLLGIFIARDATCTCL